MSSNIAALQRARSAKSLRSLKNSDHSNCDVVTGVEELRIQHMNNKKSDAAFVEKKLADWEAQKQMYQKLVDEGDAERLQMIAFRQQTKLDRAIRRGKSPAYIRYKLAKITWTLNAIEAAKLHEANFFNELKSKLGDIVGSSSERSSSRRRPTIDGVDVEWSSSTMSARCKV